MSDSVWGLGTAAVSRTQLGCRVRSTAPVNSESTQNPVTGMTG